MNQHSQATHKRFGIVALIFMSVVINYMHRNTISVAALEFQGELGLSTKQVGLIFSAFGMTYAWLQVPGGFIVDVVKPRILYTLLLGLWSVAALCQGLVNSLAALVGCRLSLGVFQTPSFPCHNRMVTTWFPDNERARAIAFYTSGQFLGLATMTPLLMLLQKYVGWRWMLITAGSVGLVWAVIWYLRYRDPRDHPRVNQVELDYIAEGGGLIDGAGKTDSKGRFAWSDLGHALGHRKLWGIYLGQFCMGGVTMFFLTWFPMYLKDAKGFDYKASAWLIPIPFLALGLGVLLSGAVSDRLKRMGCSAALARKLPVVCGLLLSCSIMGANYTDNTALMMFFLAFASFSNGLACIAWVFVSALAPKNLLGLVGGVFNFVGNLSGIVVPTVIGYLVRDEGKDYSLALVFVAVMALMSVFFYTVVVGKVERIEIDSRSQIADHGSQ